MSSDEIRPTHIMTAASARPALAIFLTDIHMKEKWPLMQIPHMEKSSYCPCERQADACALAGRLGKEKR